MNNQFLDIRVLATTFTFFTLSFTECEIAMKVIAFILTIGYTARRWYMLEKNKKE